MPGRSYDQLWHLWALRTGVIPHAVDPIETPAADYDAWASALDWLDTATDADLTAIDRLAILLHDLHRAKTRDRREGGVEERIAAAERAILGD